MALGTQEIILAHARDLYLEEGLHGLSMRKLAKRVGLTATAIYRHFEDKEDLLAKVIEEGFEIFASYLHRSLSGTTPEERMLMSGEAYLDFALDHPKYYEIIFVLPDAIWRKRAPEGGHASNQTFRFLTDRVRECMESGALPKGDAEEVALSMWAHVHGLVSLYLGDRLSMGKAEFRGYFMRSKGGLLK